MRARGKTLGWARGKGYKVAPATQNGPTKPTPVTRGTGAVFEGSTGRCPFAAVGVTQRGTEGVGQAVCSQVANATAGVGTTAHPSARGVALAALGLVCVKGWKKG